MKFLFTIIPVLFTAHLLTAQHIAVKSFRMLENDLDARTNFPMKDQNGDVCALIKAVTTETGFDWDGDQLGIVKILQKTGEIWIYVPFGAKRITIKHALLGVLRSYAYPLNIEKATVYEMALTTGKVVTTVQEEKIKTAWLVVHSNPADADVYIKDVLKGRTSYTEKMKPGRYDYRVEKTLYHSESGTMEITGNEPHGKKEISVTLRPAFGYLQIATVPENGASVFIDDVELTEKTPCKSNMLKSGMHRVTCRLDMYQPKSMDVLIEDEKTANQTMTLTPNFSLITITSKPPANIYIDGVKAGEGKYTGRILPGLHTIEGKLAQHESDERDIETAASKDAVLNLAPRPMVGDVDITSRPIDASVYINNVLKGTTPLILNKMLIGTYQLSLKKTGFETVSKNIEVQEGKTTEIDETLRAGKRGAADLAQSGAPKFGSGINSNTAMLGIKNTLSGYIKDAASGEDLIGAMIYVKEISTGTNTNAYGFYSLSLSPGVYHLTVSFLGYASQNMEVNLTSNQEMNFKLSEQTVHLEEVEVKGERADKNVSHVQMSVNRLNMNQLKKVPALLGEADIMKMAQTQPGVIAIGEGNSSLFVRGGSGDQNLILMDEAPVYDPSHQFGLFSIFNTDIVKGAELYKGGIPSRFGGRLSSVFDVRTKDGNTEKFAGAGGISILTARLMLEGPVVKSKGSFIVSGRSSLFSPFVLGSPKEMDMSYYDLNAKLNWKSSNKNRCFLSLYSGRDSYGIKEFATFKWGNTTGTFRWNHVFNDKLFLNTTVLGSKFDYNMHLLSVLDFKLTSYITQFSVYNDLNYYLNPKTELTMGYHITYQHFFPGLIKPASSTSFFTEKKLNEEYGLDHAFYGEVHQSLGRKWDVRAGLRLSVFQCIGEADVVRYRDPKNNVSPVRTDTLHYSSFQTIKTFVNPEPRFSMRYQLNETSSLKVSYNRMAQNTHLINSGTTPMPFNTWAPSGYYLKTQLADQYAAGYFKNLKDNMYELSGEVFYKKMTNITDFADNTNINFNSNIAVSYRQGNSVAYGAELYAQKKTGAFTGNLSYTWSKATRTIEGVNQGETFFSNYDRRNAVNLTAAYDASDRWTFGAFFTYATGRPITLPIGSYTFDALNVSQLSARNDYRLQDFHRLDLSATHTSRKSKNRRWKDQWIFSIYNVYNRKNPFTVAITGKPNADGNGITDKKAELVYLFSILPQITYVFKF